MDTVGKVLLEGRGSVSYATKYADKSATTLQDIFGEGTDREKGGNWCCAVQRLRSCPWHIKYSRLTCSLVFLIKDRVYWGIMVGSVFSGTYIPVTGGFMW